MDYGSRAVRNHRTIPRKTESAIASTNVWNEKMNCTMVHDYVIHIYLIYMISSRNIAEYKRTYVGNVFSPVANKRLENAAS